MLLLCTCMLVSNCSRNCQRSGALCKHLSIFHNASANSKRMTMKRRLAVALFLLSSLLACSTSSPTTRHNCPATGCDVVIRVVGSAAACTIEYVDKAQERLVMPARTRRVPIRWALEDLNGTNDSAGKYKFESDAFFLKDIVLYNPFKEPRPIGNGTRFQLLNENDNDIEYRYGLIVHSRGTPAHTCPVDPFIQNVN